MDDLNILDKPKIYAQIVKKSKEIGFTMPSDLYVGTLLKTLTTSKPKANILELGTGVGLSLSWMIDGMDAESHLTSIDNDPKLSSVANHFFENDDRVAIICADGATWIKQYKGEKFDLIFADAWPGKYSEVDATLNLLKVGGLYVIDDMQTQPNWPEGHQQNVDQLVNFLENREDLSLTKMNWSTGIIIASKKH